MEFKTYFFDMTPAEREAFAARVHSTRGTLTQVAYGNKSIELGFADVICAQSGGKVTHDGLPLTANAVRQRELRAHLVAVGVPGAAHAQA